MCLLQYVQSSHPQGPCMARCTTDLSPRRQLGNPPPHSSACVSGWQSGSLTMSVNVVINETLAMHGIFTSLPWCRTMPCIIDTATFYSNRWGSNLGINLFHKSDMWFCKELFFSLPSFSFGLTESVFFATVDPEVNSQTEQVNMFILLYLPRFCRFIWGCCCFTCKLCTFESDICLSVML